MSGIDGSCLYQIHELLPSLSAKERVVADFILAAPSESVHPSIEELSARIGVSESTLFRFVRRLGYDGYQQFRIALATESMEPRQAVYEAELEAGDERSAMSLVFQTNIAALERTMAALDPEDIGAAADYLMGARHVLLIGLGGSSIVAQDAFHKLIRTGIPCCAPTDYHMQLMAASRLEKGDLAFVLSHTGANKDTIAVADEAKRSGAQVLVLTDYPRSPLVKLADLALIAHGHGSGYASESFSARIVQLAIIDSLYLILMERSGAEGRSRLERVRGAIARRRT